MSSLPFDPILGIALLAVLGLFAYGLVRLLPQTGRLISDLQALTRAASRVRSSQDDGELDASIASDSELSVVWRRLKASRFTANTGRLVLAHEPADLLTADELLDATKEFRFWSAIPNYLVGLGLGFTFLGLVFALQSIDATNLDDPNQLTKLFAAMKFKFIASMAGIFSSILFSWILRSRVGVVHHLCAELQAALATRYPVVDPVVNALAALTQRVSDVEAHISESRVFASRTADATERSLGIWGNVVDQLNTAATQLKKFNDELSISIGNVLEQRFEQKLLPPISNALKSLELAVHGVRDAQLQADGQMVGGVVEKFREAVTGGTATEVKAIAATLAQLNESLGTTKADLANIGKTIESNIVAGLEGATGQLSHSIATLSRQLADTLNTASGNLATRLDAATDEAGSRFANTVDKLQALLEQARGTVVAGTTSAESTEKIVARFSDIAAKLELAQVGFGKIADPVQRAAERLDVVAEHVQQASEAIERSALHTNSIEERVSASWLQASERFATVDGDLAKIFADLSTGLASYAATVNDFNGKLTSEFTKALGSLQGIVGDLDDTLQEMQAHVGKAGR